MILGPYSSKIARLSYVVPQGAILVPALLALYVHVASGVGITFSFAVLQINSFAFKSRDSLISAVFALDVKQWISFYFLKLNENKTDIFISGNSVSKQCSGPFIRSL